MDSQVRVNPGRTDLKSLYISSKEFVEFALVTQNTKLRLGGRDGRRGITNSDTCLKTTQAQVRFSQQK